MKTKLLRMMKDRILSIDYSSTGYTGPLIAIKYVDLNKEIDTFFLDVRSDKPGKLIYTFELIGLIKFMFGSKFADKLEAKHKPLQTARRLKMISKLSSKKIIYKF